jgi:putative transposase
LNEIDNWVAEGFPVTRATTALEVPRSLYYYHRENEIETKEDKKRGRPNPGYSYNHSGIKISDVQIQEFLMDAIEGEEGIYGYRKLTHYLRTEHQLKINPKKVYRLCEELGILLPQRRAISAYPRRLAKQHIITEPNQMWQLDIKYGSIKDSGRFFFLASAIDVFDRSIVAYYKGSRCQATDITKVLKTALLRRQVYLPKRKEELGLIIRTDNGPQFLSKAFGEFCELTGVYHERIPPKSPNLNAFIESFHSVLEKECYQKYDFECFDEAYFRIDEYIEFYNQRRYHGSLKYLSPQQFHERYKEVGYPLEMAISL